MEMEQGMLVAHRLAVAPMINRTDRHFRFLMRLITRRTWLYSEMIVARALQERGAARLLRRSAAESPVALQVGGSEPAVLVHAARSAHEHGYDEINLNVGCPSPRVTTGRMGACLMAEPARVGDCVAAMRAASPLPVTVKTRLGIDELDDFEFLCRFVESVSAAGCGTVIVHARKAWLDGLNAKANRSVPALDYGRVCALKTAYPALEVVINGGIRDLDAAVRLLHGVDGAMLGRAAYSNPMLFAEADQRIFGDSRQVVGVAHVVAAYLGYLHRCVEAGEALRPALRHLAGVVAGFAGARAIRARLAAPGAARDLVSVERVLAPVLSARAA